MKRHNLEKKCGKVDLRYIEVDDDYEEDVRAFFKDIDLDDWRDEWFADEEEPYEVDWSDEWPSDDPYIDKWDEWHWTENDDSFSVSPS